MPYVQHSAADVEKMLKTIGVRKIEDLFAHIPQEVRFKGDLRLPEPLSDMEALRRMASLASANRSSQGVCFLGGGCYDHFVPSAVDLLSMRGEFYTAYTPYQPEASQGMLQVFFEYQSMMAALTGMEISNASLYDGASGLAEAALMAWSAQKKKKPRILISSAIHPEYAAALRTYSRHLGVSVESIPLAGGVTDPAALAKMAGQDAACVAAASPNVFGLVEDLEPLASAAHAMGALFIAVSDPVSLGLLKPPGGFGADIATGEGQGLGNYMSFGGPHFGFLTAKEDFVRSMPGRIVGMTEDGKGRKGFVLTFQTREQHIRREKATSNICTNQALCALRAALYLALLGPDGLRKTASLCASRAHKLAERLSSVPRVELRFKGPFFKEFALKLPCDAATIIRRLARRGIYAGPSLGEWFPDMADTMLVAATERRTPEEIEMFREALDEELKHV